MRKPHSIHLLTIVQTISIFWLFTYLPQTHAFLFFSGGYSASNHKLIGKTASSFAVSKGAATYTIPIIVPPGEQSLTPKLSLNYHSKSSPGIMGVGWHISGISVISRCGKTLPTDGIAHKVQLDNQDRFCLNGHRLILISGTYGADGSEYRTEIASQQKIIAHGQAGNGPAWFKVYTKSGEIMEFGHSDSSRVEAQGKATVFNWLISRISNRYNKHIDFNYSERNQYSESVLTQVSYSIGGNHQVSVNYSYADLDHKLIPDTAQNKIAGSRVNQSRYLSKVQVNMNNHSIRTYTPTYKHRQNNNRLPLLTELQECVEGKCLPKIQFTWAEQQALQKSNLPDKLSIPFPYFEICDTNEAISYYTLWSNHNPFFQVSKYCKITYDFNRDGINDRVDNNKIYLGLGDGKEIDLGQTTRLDYNGDGAVDKLTAKTFSHGSVLYIESAVSTQDLLTIIDNDNHQTIITYMDGSKDNHYQPISSSLLRSKEAAITRPGFLVKQVQIPNGIGGTVETTYRYSGGKNNPSQRGRSGIQWIESHNQQSGQKTRTEFYVNWPYTGSPKRTRTWQNNQLLSDTTWQYQSKKRANITAVWHSQKETKTYAPEGNHLSTQLSQMGTPDRFGNISKITQTTEDHINHLTWETHTENTYQNTPNTWLIGKLTRSEVTHKKTGHPNISKTATFQYNWQGLLSTEISEPDDTATLYQKITHQYNSHGDKIATIYRGKNAQGQWQERKTQTQLSYLTYGNKPSKKIILTNPMGQQETRIYQLKHNALIAHTGPNNLSTHWYYDALGRKIQEVRADGTISTWQYQQSNWSGATYQTVQQNPGAASITTYFDALNRQVRVLTTAVNGQSIITDKRYDNLGHEKTRTHPHFSGETAAKLESYYDRESRLIRQDRPNANGTHDSTHYRYDAYQHTKTDPLGNQKTTHYDAKGNIIKTEQGRYH